MAEYTRKVRVTDLVYSDGNTRFIDYDDVKSVKVDDGHLSLSTGVEVVAAYAPGQWVRVERLTTG